MLAYDSGCPAGPVVTLPGNPPDSPVSTRMHRTCRKRHARHHKNIEAILNRSSMADGLRVLYVDDEPGLLELAKIFLEKTGEFQVGIATSATGVLDIPLSQSYDAIVSDYEMPEMDGIAFLKYVRHQFGDIPFILFTGKGREEVVIDAINNGADFYLQKGGSAQAQFAELAHKIRQAVSKRRAQVQLREAYDRITASEEELARSELAVQESERKFRDFADHLPQMVFETDMELRITYVNKYTRSEYGFTPAMLEEKTSILTFIHPSQHGTFMDSVHNLMYGIPFEPKEYTAFNKDGGSFPVIVYSSPIFRSKQLVGFRGVVVDISVRKRAEQALRESEEKHRTFAELLPQIVFEIDLSDRLTFVNRQAYIQFGWSPEEVAIGFNALSVIDPSQHARLRKNMESLVRGEPYDYEEYTLIRRDGSTFPALIYAVPVKKDGRLTGFRGIIFDISEQKRSGEALRESEEKFRTLVEVNQDVVYSLDSAGIILYMSPQVTDQLGYRPDEMEGRDFLEFMHPDDRERITRIFRENRQVGSPLSQDRFRVQRKDGTYRWYEDKAINTRSPQGDLVTIGTARDITEQKKAHEALIESEARFRDLTDRLPQMIFETDLDLRITYANRHAARVTGFSSEELAAGKPVLSLIDPGQHAGFRGCAGNLLSGISFEPNEYTAIRKDGSTFPVVVYSSPIYRNRKITGFRGIAVDISGLRKMEEGIRESEEKFRSLVENASDIVFSLDRAGNFTYISPRWTGMLGYDTEPFIGTPAADLIHPEDVADNIRAFRTVMSGGGRIRGLEYRILHRDGTWRWHSQSAAAVRNAAGEVIAYQGICHDMTDRRRSEAALRESENKFSTIFRNSQIALTLLSVKDNRFFDVNDAFVRNSGYSREDVLGKTPWDIGLLVNPDVAKRIASVLKRDRHIDATEVRFRTRSGVIQTCLYAANLITMKGELYLLSSVIDISERKNAEEALRQANRKLNILSGITRHDINNQLQALGNYVELLRHSVPEDSHDHHFSRIGTTIEQITGLIQFTREYEMIGVHEPVWQEARDIVSAAGKAALPTTIRLANELPENLEIYADPLISKVFFNLLDNARRHGGKIRQVRFLAEEMNGDRIIVCTDDGDGVPPGEKERIFEPGIGKNTGFGLAISREILDITGITIRENGRNGNGARFEITVPAGKFRLRS